MITVNGVTYAVLVIVDDAALWPTGKHEVR
jgi:hypothetical protein